jgi:hypothetical protein
VLWAWAAWACPGVGPGGLGATNQLGAVRSTSLREDVGLACRGMSLPKGDSPRAWVEVTPGEEDVRSRALVPGGRGGGRGSGVVALPRPTASGPAPCEPVPGLVPGAPRSSTATLCRAPGVDAPRAAPPVSGPLLGAGPGPGPAPAPPPLPRPPPTPGPTPALLPVPLPAANPTLLPLASPPVDAPPGPLGSTATVTVPEFTPSFARLAARAASASQLLRNLPTYSVRVDESLSLASHLPRRCTSTGSGTVCSRVAGFSPQVS